MGRDLTVVNTLGIQREDDLIDIGQSTLRLLGQLRIEGSVQSRGTPVWTSPMLSLSSVLDRFPFHKLPGFGPRGHACHSRCSLISSSRGLDHSLGRQAQQTVKLPDSRA